MSDEFDNWHEAPTVKDFRERAEQITGLDFEGAKPRDLTWKDWRNLVHFLETEVGDSADNSATEVDNK